MKPISATKKAAIAIAAGVSAPGSGACCTSMRTPRAARSVMKAESAVRKLGGGTVRACAPSRSVIAIAPSANRTCFTWPRVDLLQELGERELGRAAWRRLDVDPRGDQRADEQGGRDDETRAPEQR